LQKPEENLSWGSWPGRGERVARAGANGAGMEVEMFHRRLCNCQEFAGGDGTVLREYLHADKAPLALGYSLAHATLGPGQKSHVHRLAASEVYCMLSGRGRLHVDAEVYDVEPGDVVYIPPGAAQWLENPGPEEVKFLCIVEPAWRPDLETIDAERAPGRPPRGDA
jgi:mannose-6-phosphate isomerase-like protein (cupin superfamily)